MKKTIVQLHKKNFNTLRSAFHFEDVALMECRRRKDGKIVAMICCVDIDKDKNFSFTPFAEMINGNPFDMYDPPNTEGGFHGSEEQVEA